jgi:hypothetical protein
MKRYNIDVKYKTYITTSVSLNAENPDDAVKALMDGLDVSAVEDFEIVSVTEIGDEAMMAPSTDTAQ